MVSQIIGREKDSTRQVLRHLIFWAQKPKKNNIRRGEEPHVLIVNVDLFTLRTSESKKMADKEQLHLKNGNVQSYSVTNANGADLSHLLKSSTWITTPQL
jgi:hypothetical protein